MKEADSLKSVRELFDKKLGFGMMRLPVNDVNEVDEARVNEMVDEFISNGFNYFDTAYVYHGGKSEEVVRKCLVERYDREKFILATKLPSFIIEKAEEMPTIFNTQLERCGVSYFDLYLVHALNAKDYEKMNGFKAFEFVQDLKNEGKVKYMGFSFHDKAEVLDKILNEHPEVDFVQLQINYYDWEKDNVEAHKCYDVAAKHNVPIIVMEPIKGGSLIDLPNSAMKLLDSYDGSPASLAIRYVASKPQVMMVLSGMSSLEQMKDNISYMKELKPITEKEEALTEEIVKIIDSIPTVPCTGCKYCIDGCPMKIRINAMFSLYNDDMKFHKGEPNKKAYERIARDEYGKASDCVKCGACEGVCPQHLPIRDNLEMIAKTYEI